MSRARVAPRAQAPLWAALCACSDHQDALLPRGPQARHIADVWWLYLTVCCIVAFLVIVFVLAAIWTRRAGEQVEPPALSDDAAPPEGSEAQPVRRLSAAGEKRKLHGVLAASAITVVTLFVLLVSSVVAGKALTRLHPTDAPVIEITGLQWWWRIRYLDADPSKTFETANELHIPVGRPVVLQLKSADVIHSMWIPNLHGKTDLIPGQENRMVIQADRAGTYLGQCAEFCGFEHARMGLRVIAEPDSSFEAYRVHQRGSAPNPRTAREQRGLDVFMNGPCVLCHTISGTRAGSAAGPDLTHLASRETLAAGTLPNQRAHLSRWLEHPQSVKPGVRMPDLSLPQDDLDALLAYLETLR